MKDRSRISRRAFLNLAGLSGSSLAASWRGRPRSAPGSERHLDANGRPTVPWWVRSVEQPTSLIDWDRIQRFDIRHAVQGAGFDRYVGEQVAERARQKSDELDQERLRNSVPGFTLKDYALQAAQRSLMACDRSFLGPQRVPTPQEQGVEPLQATEQEAARILRVAMRHFGAASVGFVRLDDQTRKLIYTHDVDGKQLVFDDVEQAIETETERIIPLKARTVIVYTVQMSNETFKRAPTLISDQTTWLAYARGLHIQVRTQEFLRGLGYACLGEARMNSLGIAPAFGVLAGLGEMSRQNRMITPQYGPLVRIFKLITDLPVAPDRPIDAGILRFCRQCKKCAEACPAGALSLSDDPTWEVQGEWNSGGHQSYFEDSVKCYRYWQEGAGTGCGICFSVCPFSKKDKVWLHQGVKATIATLPIFDGLLRSLDDAFSYGARKDPELWWSLDLPEYGIDSETIVED